MEHQPRPTGPLPGKTPASEPQDPATPELRAALMTHADWIAGTDAEVRSFLGDPERFESPSLRFLAAGLASPGLG